MLWLIQLTGIVLILVGSPLMWGVTQTVKARLQGRRGPSIFQMYRTIAKNWTKETTVPEFSSWVFKVAPSVTLSALLTILVMIPVSGRVPPNWPHDLLVVFFLLALERVWVGLSGLDSAGTFGGLGSSRVGTIGTGIEPALLVCFGVLWRSSGFTSIEPVSVSLGMLPGGLLLRLVAAASFSLIMLAELGRLPVDNPDTHLELTMMHEATILQYDGRLLALSQLAMAVKLAVIPAIGWVILGPHLHSLWLDLALLLLELLCTAVVLGWAESRFSKIRYFQLPIYLSVAAGLGLVGFYLASGGLSQWL